MKHFSAKFQEMTPARGDKENLLSRIHGRPLAERRALFFATFVISSAILSSLWMSYMYHQFGLAFLGGNTATAPVAANPAPQDSSKASENSENADSGVLKNPFAIATENFEVLKQSLSDLLSRISSNPEAANTNRVAAPPEDAVKEPPVLTSDSQNNTEGSAFPGDTGAAVPLQTPTPSPASPQPPAAQEKPVSATPRKAADTGVAQSKQPPLVISPAKNQGGVTSAFHEMGESPAPAENEPAVAETTQTPQPEKKQSRFVSILTTNFALIQESFKDFYDYLTQ